MFYISILFGLKVTISILQKAMTRIFEPILSHALIYVDDILLFNKDKTSHHTLLSSFLKIVENYGIILSAKKGVLGQSSINFLCMIIKNE